MKDDRPAILLSCSRKAKTILALVPNSTNWNPIFVRDKPKKTECEVRREVSMATMALPSFFKVLVPGFYSKLSIPPLFGKTFEHMLAESALLQTKSEATWSVKLERIGEQYFFTDGWPKFVKDHGLKMGEFLVFWLMPGEMNIFKVAMYGTTGCDKDLNATAAIHDPRHFRPRLIDQLNPKINRNPLTKLSKSAVQGSRKRKSKEIEDDERSIDDGKYFTKVLTNYHRYRMMPFARKHGLVNKSEMMLQNMNGASWRVELRLYDNDMLFMCKGWPDFLQDNALVLGVEYAFEFIPETDSIRVQPFKEFRSSAVQEMLAQ